MLLLLDNYDSFVHNLDRHFRRLGQETVVMRNDAVDWRGVRSMGPAAVVISPGPCTPNEAGNSLEVVRALSGELPMLGVCLGHQVIAAAFGAGIVRAREPIHGRTSTMRHDGRGLFGGLPSPLSVCRYHSLAVDERTLGEELAATAWAADGTVMAIAHRSLPVWGVQFHCEAVLTEHGYAMLANFLRLAGLSVGGTLPEGEVAPAARAAEGEMVDWPLPGRAIANG
jgi:anthranilate synthase/aminodeoxychorismate synthase-like glutamine amidotransferase